MILIGKGAEKEGEVKSDRKRDRERARKAKRKIRVKARKSHIECNKISSTLQMHKKNMHYAITLDKT